MQREFELGRRRCGARRGGETEARPNIVVAVAFDRASRVALARADEFARCTGARLRLVHVVPRAMRRPDPVIRARVAELAARALGRRLAEDDIVIRSGNPIAEIWREAHRLAAELLVLGGATEGRTSSWRARFLAQHARRPVLLASEPHQPGLVAATDLRDQHLPVVRWAAQFARQTGVPLGIVHNAGRPARAELAEVGAELLSTVADADLEPAPVSEVPVSVRSERAASAGILEAARESDADLVVVGARETSGRTMRSVTLNAHRSVVAVPLRRG